MWNVYMQEKSWAKKKEELATISPVREVYAFRYNEKLSYDGQVLS